MSALPTFIFLKCRKMLKRPQWQTASQFDRSKLDGR